MHVISSLAKLRDFARVPLIKSIAAGVALASSMLAAPLAHAGFQNGGFEDADFTGWTLKSYDRASSSTADPTTGVNPVPPTQFSHLKLTLSADKGLSQVLGLPVATAPNAPGLSYPRWGNNAARVNNQGGRAASSIEQAAVMTTADVDPVDGKIHIRFGMAPVLNNPTGHGAHEQPFFYVEVNNITKGTRLFTTFNYSNQSGVPWQGTIGGYLYTDWQGFDVSPGNGLLDVGDNVQLIVYASNCSQGASNHEARVYLDAVGAFLPGLSVVATGPSTTKPSEQITYTYNYSNNSGLLAVGSKVRVAAPKTEDGLFTTFVPNSWPTSCTGPTPGVAPRADYLDCEVGPGGALNDGQTGSFNVTFTVPAGAATTAPSNVINNGDYDIRSSTASAFIGPLVKTTILPAATPTTDIGVTVSNGGNTSYAPADTPVYTVTVTNNSVSDVTGASVTQTLTGVAGGTWVCTVPAGSTASCGATANGAGPIATATANLPANQSLTYTYTGGTLTGVGTPANTVVTVAPPAGTQDTQASNNTAGLNTPVGTQYSVTAKATGAGQGGILAVPSGLACAAPCSTTGTTGSVADLQQVRLTAVATTGSIFTGWTGCTSVVGNLCVIDVNGANATATANFALSYVVTPTVVPGGGTITPPTPTQVEGGGTTIYTMVPGPGNVTVITPPPSGTACTGTLDASVLPNTYTVTPVNADCGFTVAFSAGVTLTSSVVGGNGAIGPLGATVPLVPGSNSTVYTLTPAPGFTPVVGGTCKGTQDVLANTYTVTNATADCTVIASFTNDPVTVTSSTTGGNGSIDTAGTVNLPRGGARTYTFTPAAGYYPLVTGNCPGTLTGNTYSVSPVNANCAFNVTFTNQTVNVTGTVTGGGGTITPPGVTTVARGGGLTYTATPGAGNVAVFTSTCPGTRVGDTFIVANAQADCGVDVKFVAAAAAITVTTSVPGGNGTVTTPGQNGLGETVLAIGDTRVWTVTPTTAGFVPRLIAGSTCTGTLSAAAPYTYTVNAAAASCTANFAFAAAAPAAVASIPTLSEWGLIILSGLMGLLMLGMRRRQMH